MMEQDRTGGTFHPPTTFEEVARFWEQALDRLKAFAEAEEIGRQGGGGLNRDSAGQDDWTVPPPSHNN